MCFSCCACGGNTEKEPNDETKTPTIEAEVPETDALVIGETYFMPEFDITITGFDFSQKATFPDGDGFNLVPQKGYVTANIYYNIKYKGKVTTYEGVFKPNWIVYDDGYKFKLEKFYYYDTGVDSWLNAGDVDPLSPEFPCKACFFVPDEVETNTEKTLLVEFMFGTFDARTVDNVGK